MRYPFKKIVFDCHKATLLSLKKEEGKITLVERLTLWYHLLYCGVCRQFIKQSLRINHIGATMNQALFNRPTFTLSEEKKRSFQQQVDLLNK